jgi:CHAD domain-containing protein
MSKNGMTPAGEALRQAILEALLEIDARLSGEMSAAEIHLARRGAKRARALARLAPAGLASLARNTRRIVDRARRALGAARDVEVRAKTLDALKPRLGSAHEALARLADAPPGEAGAAVEPALREELAALVRDWRLCEADGALDDIVAAAGVTYRRMRKRAKAARDGDSEALHHWRAAVVDFEYDMDFLSRFSADMKRKRRDADRLRQYLGDINDLDELCGHVRRRADPGDQVAVHDLEKAGAARRARLLARALAIADDLLELKPAQWIRETGKSCAR